MTSSYLAAQYLKKANFTEKVFVIGTIGISQELDKVGIRHIGISLSVGPFSNNNDNLPMYEIIIIIRCKTG